MGIVPTIITIVLGAILFGLLNMLGPKKPPTE